VKQAYVNLDFLVGATASMVLYSVKSMTSILRYRYF